MSTGIRGVVLPLAVLLTAFGAPAASGGEERPDVKMRIIVTNPHKTEKRSITVNKPLPPEITEQKYIISHPGLQIVYDPKSSLFYARSKGPIELDPAGQKIFVVTLEDRWYIPPEKMDVLRKRLELARSNVSKTSENYEASERMGREIEAELKGIADFQDNPALSKEQYILGFQANMRRLRNLQGEIETIESFSKPPGTDKVLEDEDAPVDTPTRTATWLVIFVILTFLGIMAGIFFYVWQRSARALEAPLGEARRNAFPESGQNGGE
jgi:hypothetical protein